MYVFDANQSHIYLQMSLCITGNRIVDESAEIYSVTERPVPPHLDTPHDQILITVVANGTTGRAIEEELIGQLQILTRKFDCDFTELRRFGKYLCHFVCSC